MVSTAIGPPDTTCGYTPSGFGLRGVGHYRAKHGRPGHGADERARRRHPPAPLHGEPGGRDRDALAGPLGARGHVQRAEPHRALRRGVRPGRRPERQSGEWGKSAYVRVDLAGWIRLKTKKTR